MKHSSDPQRILGFWDSSSIILGIVIGVGIFRVPSDVAQYIPCPQWALAAWLIGGLICVTGALCFAELATLFPETGGAYVYLKESYGPGVGFLFGWVELLIIRPGAIAGVSFVFAEAVLSLFQLNPWTLKWVAGICIGCLMVINLCGLRYTKEIQKGLVGVFLFIFLIVLSAAVFSGKGNPNFLHWADRKWEAGFWRSMGLGLIPILWTYGGWHENTFLGGETRNPRRLLPAALVLSIGVITLIYVMTNAVYFYLFPWEQIRSSGLVMSDATRLIFGPVGQKIFEILLIFTAISSSNGTLMTGSRVAYALSRDHRILGVLSRVSGRQRTPYAAIIFISFLSLAMVFVSDFHRLIFFTGVAVWIFFAFIAGSLFILRLKGIAGLKGYSTYGYPVIPLVFLAACIFLFANTLIAYPAQSMIGCMMILSGIPVYMLSKKTQGLP